MCQFRNFFYAQCKHFSHQTVDPCDRFGDHSRDPRLYNPKWEWPYDSKGGAENFLLAVSSSTICHKCAERDFQSSSPSKQGQATPSDCGSEPAPGPSDKTVEERQKNGDYVDDHTSDTSANSNSNIDDLIRGSYQRGHLDREHNQALARARQGTGYVPPNNEGDRLQQDWVRVRDESSSPDINLRVQPVSDSEDGALFSDREYALAEDEFEPGEEDEATLNPGGSYTCRPRFRPSSYE